MNFDNPFKRNRVKPWRPKQNRGADAWLWVLLLVALLLMGGYWLIQRRLAPALVRGTQTPTPNITLTPTLGVDDFVAFAKQAAQEGRLREAIDFYDKAIRRRPNELAWQIDAAKLTAYSGQYIKAEQRIRRVLQTNPKNATALTVLCYALEYQKRADEALVACEQATKLEPQNASALAFLAEAQADRNNCTEAQTAAQQAADLDPQNLDALHKLAYVREVCGGNYDSALAYYQNALNVNPNALPVLMDVGRVNLILASTGSPYYATQAVNVYSQTIALDDQNAEAYSQLGVAYMMQGEYGRGLRAHEKAIKLEPNRIRFLTNRGWLYYRRLLYEEAAQDYARAVALSAAPNPSEKLKPIDLIRYGLSLSELKKCAEAVPVLNQAAELSNSDATLLGYIQAGLKDCGQ